jgi:zinc transporter, ZIP family
MSPDFALLLAIAAAGALASPLGGAAALLRKPTSLFLSIAVGFAAGILLATFAFEMLPQAVETASLAIALIGFAAGFCLILALDLFIHRGAVAGERSEQRRWVVRHGQRRKSRGDEVTVLAGGTSAEEIVEGIAIGVSAATDPTLGMIVGLAIFIDNVAESLSIGELCLARGGDRPARRILFWTGLIGLSLFVSALVGWWLLRDLSPDALGLLLAAGAGGMFYLTVTELVPEAESHQFNQSAAIAMAAGFLLIFALSRLA